MTLIAFAALGFAVYVLFMFRAGYALGFFLDARRSIAQVLSPVDRITGVMELIVRMVKEQR